VAVRTDPSASSIMRSASLRSGVLYRLSISPHLVAGTSVSMIPAFHSLLDKDSPFRKSYLCCTITRSFLKRFCTKLPQC
jgi:hypothetical protein